MPPLHVQVISSIVGVDLLVFESKALQMVLLIVVVLVNVKERSLSVVLRVLEHILHDVVEGLVTENLI